MTIYQHTFTGSTRVERAKWVPSDVKGEGTITCVFPDGVSWDYRHVPLDVWDEFVVAASPGAFIAERLDDFSNGPA